jgi:hypothetical protein
VTRIAALYVQTDGCYYGLPDVDPWDAARDARTYAGPWPVVAHPPCERWGRYARGGPNPNARRREIGDDGGCFAAALAAVRRWGGVLEHPAASHAWARFGLAAPHHRGGWIIADEYGGWTCHVEQGHYGHRGRKATWLYACRLPDLPSLRWGPSRAAMRMDRGFHSRAEREQHRRFMRPPSGISAEERTARRAYLEQLGTWVCPERMGKRERAATPIPFRDLLLGIAGSVEMTTAVEVQR